MSDHRPLTPVACRDDLHERLGLMVYGVRFPGCCVVITERSSPSDWTGASLFAQALDWARTPRHIKARQAVTLSADYFDIFGKLPPDDNGLGEWARRERWPEEWVRRTAKGRATPTAMARVGSVLLKVATHPRREEIRQTQGRMLAYIEAMHPRMLSWRTWRGPCSRRAFAQVVEDWWEGARAHLEDLDDWRRRLADHNRMAQGPSYPSWFDTVPPAAPVFTWPS